MKYHIITYGCQMNHSDSERIASVFEKSGLKASQLSKADFIILNMCSVRQSPVDRIFGLKPAFKKTASIKILTGCVLKKDKKKMAEFFDYILNIKDLPKWPKILNLKKTAKDRSYLNIIPKYSNKFCANIPIMTGCNNFCAYCVVPYAREREISRPAKEIVCEIKNAVKNGAKEIWLLGQNVNSYKDDKTNFPKLLEMVNKIPGNFWIRFTSSHPKDFSDELIKAMAECKKSTEYLNLPVQAGDDKILKKMNRPYNIKHYKSLVKKARKAIPGITLSTDIIVGFPSETKKQFENSVKLFRELKYDMAYISQYSPRPDTLAFKMKDDVSKKEKARRAKILTEILAETALENNKNCIGKTADAIIAMRRKNFWLGKTRNYKTIKIESNKNLLGKFIKAKITEASPWGLRGILLK